MSLRCLAVTVFSAVHGMCAPAAAADSAPAAPKHTWALISAVGGSFSYVRQKMQTGSHLDPYFRANVTVSGYSLDAAVFRGLESVVRANDPDAEIFFARLDPKELEGIPAYRRGQMAIRKLASVLDKLPERKGWYRIVIMTPEFVRPEYSGLGSKLEGIGVYVKGLESNLVAGDLDILDWHEDAVTPEGKPTRGATYIAPYLHARVWVLDAQTMEVIETSERYDHEKIHDPTSVAIRIENAIPPEKLVPAMERFLERSVAQSLREAIGVVTVSDPKIVDQKK